MRPFLVVLTLLLTLAALVLAALAGGRVVGALVLAQEGQVQSIESGWRGRGIEQALTDAMRHGDTQLPDTSEQQETCQP